MFLMALFLVFLLTSISCLDQWEHLIEKIFLIITSQLSAAFETIFPVSLFLLLNIFPIFFTGYYYLNWTSEGHESQTFTF